MNQFTSLGRKRHARNSPRRKSVAFGLALFWASLASAAHGATEGTAEVLTGLEGRYVAISVDEVTTPTRPPLTDIHLEIRARGQDLLARRQALAPPSNDVEHHYEVVFEKSRRPGIYLAGMRCDGFGHPRPLDLARGEPYMWAFLADGELTLDAMSIADDGTHDLSVYRYRRDGGRVALTFERVRNDRPVERVAAVLQRAGIEARAIRPAPRRTGERHASVRCD